MSFVSSDQDIILMVDIIYNSMEYYGGFDMNILYQGLIIVQFMDSTCQ
jgi:hypothetical protein